MTRRIVVTDPADPPADGETLVYDAASDTWLSSSDLVAGNASLRQVSDTLNPEIVLERADAGPASVDTGDILGEVEFRGYDGSDYVTGATIKARPDATPGSGNMPTELVFSTFLGGGALTERWRIGAGGALTPVTDASVNLGTASLRPLNVYTAQGIQFPATQNPSSDANNLDDYEEGIWTPTGNNVTFASAGGAYTRIGRVVTVSFEILWPSTADGSWAASFGLPFTSGGSYGGIASYTTYGTAPLVPALPTGVTYIGLYRGGDVAVLNSDMSGESLIGSLTYAV